LQKYIKHEDKTRGNIHRKDIFVVLVIFDKAKQHTKNEEIIAKSFPIANDKTP
tara:strand:+ start:223 stop:381 length:159 start_codon:yes stop_codon:yes gene_type:complete